MNAAERQQWLTDRRVGDAGTRVCSTDVGAILGVSRWATKLSVFNDKLMLVEDMDEAESELMRWGKELEPFLARRYAHVIGVPDSDIVLGSGVIVDPSNPRFACSPDIARVKGRRRGCELKVTGFKEARGTLRDNGFDYGWGDEGTSDVPDDYSVQSHWCLSVSRRIAKALNEEPFDFWDVAVLFGGRDFQVFTIPFDKRIDDALRGASQKFIDQHLDVSMPPNAVADDEDLITAMFHGDKEADMLKPEADLLALAQGYVTRHAALKQMTEVVKGDKVRLKQIIGEATGITLPNGYLSYYAAKTKHKESTDWEKVARTLFVEMKRAGNEEDADSFFEEALNTHTRIFDGFGNRSLRVNIKKEKKKS